MSKSAKAALFLDRNKVPEYLNDFCKNCFSTYNIGDSNLINEKTGQTRYSISTDIVNFDIDLFFRPSDGKTTPTALGSGDKRTYSEKLCEFLKNQAEYQDAPAANFSASIKIQDFNLLIEYLSTELEGVEMSGKETVNNGIGEKYQFISSIGDKITLTHFESNGTLVYQGKLMKLFIEVKTFLAPFLTAGDNGKIKEASSQKLHIHADTIESELKTLLQNSYVKIDEVILEFLYDSLVYKQCDIPHKEYSSYAFPALKALEWYIKKLFGDNSISINVKEGFSRKISGKRVPYFAVDSSTGKYVLNSGINTITCTKTCLALEQCYNYYNANRHVLFHTDQNATMTTVLKSKSDAVIIIDKVFGLIENTYTSIII